MRPSRGTHQPLLVDPPNSNQNASQHATFQLHPLPSFPGLYYPYLPYTHSCPVTPSSLQIYYPSILYQSSPNLRNRLRATQRRKLKSMGCHWMPLIKHRSLGCRSVYRSANLGRQHQYQEQCRIVVTGLAQTRSLRRSEAVL